MTNTPRQQISSMPTPRISSTATKTSVTVISRVPCTARRPACRRTKARPARALDRRTAGVESPRRAVATRARRSPRPAQARPTPPSPTPSRTPPGTGQGHRARARWRPGSTRSSQLQRVDAPRLIRFGHELVYQDELMLPVDIEDVSVGCERAHALGDCPTSGRFGVFPGGPKRNRAEGAPYRPSHHETAPQHHDKNAGIEHSLRRQPPQPECPAQTRTEGDQALGAHRRGRRRTYRSGDYAHDQLGHID